MTQAFSSGINTSTSILSTIIIIIFVDSTLILIIIIIAVVFDMIIIIIVIDIYPHYHRHYILSRHHTQSFIYNIGIMMVNRKSFPVLHMTIVFIEWTFMKIVDLFAFKVMSSVGESLADRSVYILLNPFLR